MITWEFFAGSRSFSKEAEKRNHKTFTTDINDFDGVDLVADFMDLDIKELQKKEKPDFIWFSPPCTTFSIAGCSHHFNKNQDNYIPISDKAKTSILMLKKVNQIIEQINPAFWLIENPRGLMRKMKIIDNKFLKTTWYCKWGDLRAKPTDIWCNFEFEAKKCKNGNKECHHQPAPRGARTGTQGLKNNYERSKVPPKLINHILDEVEKQGINISQSRQNDEAIK